VPELPDLSAYLDALETRVVGRTLARIRFASPFVLRSVSPSVSEVLPREVVGLERIGKRIVLVLKDERFIVIHLMVSGRFQWKDEGNAKVPGRLGLAAFDLTDGDAPAGTLLLTEASTKKRASIHLVQGRENLASFSRGGLEPMGASFADFAAALRRERHTLKRALTDPRVFSGIGNAYSDEILHHAKMSPVKRSDTLKDEEVAHLQASVEHVLSMWTERFRAEAKLAFPSKVTAFRPEMAVHGKFDQPCPDCGSKVQRIVYAENESNYCARCQTGGKLLADRSLSRLLKDNWPKTIDELEGK
jgi:formamidopyrimidine-DNA glycosylase